MSKILLETLFVDEFRAAAGIDKFDNVSIARDEIVSIIEMSWEEKRKLSLDDLYRYLDALSGYKSHIQSSYGKVRARRILLDKERSVALYRESANYKAYSIEERIALAIDRNDDLYDLETELAEIKSKEAQLVSFLDALTSFIDRFTEFSRSRRFNDI